MMSRRFRRAAAIFGAAVGLTGAGGTARADGYVSPGLLASWTFGKHGGFGLGGELAWTHYDLRGQQSLPWPVVYGAFLQSEALFGEGRGFRGSLGAQAAPMFSPVGAELGMSLQRDSAWRGGVHGGVYASAGVASLAWRGTFSGPGEGGVQHAVVFTLKAPLMYGCVPPMCIAGRPLRGEDGMLLPDVLCDGEDALSVYGEAESWLTAARAEFASVPAFLELAADLQRAGAPVSLVDRALDAAADEVRHARLCFAVASERSGLTLRPRWMPEWSRPSRSLLQPAHDSRDAELARLAVESFEDGVLGEGRAAREALKASDGAVDPRLAQAQRGIARDEHRHARLGADLVTWCEAEGGRAVRRALSRSGLHERPLTTG